MIYKQSDFHAPKPAKQLIKLQFNSVNSAFGFCDNNGVVKVQLDKDSDPIINDAYVNIILDECLKASNMAHLRQHFMSIYGAFDAKIITSGNFNKYYIARDDNNIYRCHGKYRPCIVLQRLDGFQVLSDILDNISKTVQELNGLQHFIYALVTLGRNTGFSHHDMHSGNVLCKWLPNKQECMFALIDYGRAHIPKKNVDVLNQLKAAFGLSQFYQNTNYNLDKPRIHMQIAKPDDIYKGMYILNDIAGLTDIIIRELIRLKRIGKGRLEKLRALYKTTMGLNKPGDESVSVNDLQDDVLFGLAIGYVWFVNLLKQTADKNIDKRIMLYRNKYACAIYAYYFQTYIEESCKVIYKEKMIPFIDAWLDTYNKKKMLSGGSVQEEVKISQQDVMPGQLPSYLNRHLAIHEFVRKEENNETIIGDDQCTYMGVKADGGRSRANNRVYKLYKEKSSGRMFFRKSNKQIFLDQIRGRYRYTTQERSHVYLLRHS